MPEARLMRSENDKMIMGVCGGIAAYLGVDSVFVRLAFVLLVPASGIAVPLYIVLILIMPKESAGDRSTSNVVQDNFNKLGEDFTSGLKRMRQHTQGPTIFAGILILLGSYFLFSNIGWLDWLRGDVLWSLGLIGLGVYLLSNRNR
jgi:phage shock protein PspC (stress-responsive transcriptional regulator)